MYMSQYARLSLCVWQMKWFKSNYCRGSHIAVALTFTLVQTVFLSLAGPETSNADFWRFQEGQVMQVCEFCDHAQRSLILKLISTYQCRLRHLWTQHIPVANSDIGCEELLCSMTRCSFDPQCPGDVSTRFHISESWLFGPGTSHIRCWQLCPLC